MATRQTSDQFYQERIDTLQATVKAERMKWQVLRKWANEQKKSAESLSSELQTPNDIRTYATMATTLRNVLNKMDWLSRPSRQRRSQ